MDCIHSNGDITGYTVRYWVQESEIRQTENVSGPDHDTMNIANSGLAPEASYTVEVAADNVNGIGEYSDPLTVQAPQS